MHPKSINATLGAVSADAEQYVPDQLVSAQSKVAELAASFDKKDYAAVVKSAPAVLAEVNGLAGAVAVPQSATAVQARIDALSKTRHAPKDVDLTAAKSGLSDATSAWENAQSKFKSGNAEEAVAAAQDATKKLESAAGALKLNLPQTAS